MKKYNIYLRFVIIFFLFFMTNVFSSLFGYVAMIFVILFGIKGDSGEALSWILFLLPNIRILDVLGFTYGVNILIVIISLKILFVGTNEEGTRYINYFFRKKYILGSFIVFLLEFLHIFVDYNGFMRYLFNGTNIAFNLFVCFKILNFNLKLNDYRKMSYALIVGIFNSVIIFILANKSVIEAIKVSQYRFGAFGTDPNYLSVYVVMGMASLLTVSFYSKITFKEIILIFLLSIIELLTISKMGILSMMIVYLGFLIILILRGQLLKIGTIVIKILPIVFIVLIYFGNVLILLWDKFINRFYGIKSISELNHLTSGRSDIFIFYLNNFFDNFISFLYGRGVDYFSYYKNFGASYVAHNTYFDFILSWGILGVFIFILICYFCLRDIISFRFKKNINFLPLLVLSIMLISLSCMSSDMFWYIITFALFPLSTKFIKNIYS